MRSQSVLAFVAAVALLACGRASLVQQGPSDTLRAYAQALQEGRADDAYRLLSDEAKRSMSLEAFRRAVKESPEEIAEIARALGRPANDPVVTAAVTMPNGEDLLLVFEGGKWRVDAAAVDLYGQATPRQALVGFLRAFARKRYDVVLRYVPDAEKEGISGPTPEVVEPSPDGGAPPPKPPAAPAANVLTAEKLKASWEGPAKDEMTRKIQAITATLPNAQVEEAGDTASMPYGAGGIVVLMREHGVWKIKDF